MVNSITIEISINQNNQFQNQGFQRNNNPNVRQNFNQTPQVNFSQMMPQSQTQFSYQNIPMQTLQQSNCSEQNESTTSILS